jgi:hypothetical protein
MTLSTHAWINLWRISSQNGQTTVIILEEFAGLSIKRLLPGELMAPLKRKNFMNRLSAACECKYAILGFVTSHENNLTTDGNLGNFFPYANNKFCCNTGNFITDFEHKAEILQKAFQNNYLVDNDCLPSMERLTSNELSRVYSIHYLVRVIKKLKVKTTNGPDDPPTLLNAVVMSSVLYVEL